VADDNPAVVLFDDILSLQPQIHEFSGADEISEFMNRVMEFYEYPIFLNSVGQSDIQFLSGKDTLLIDGSTPSIANFNGSDTKATVYSGNHDFILQDSSVEINQIEGQVSIFLDNFENNDISLDILNGEASIYISDSNFDIDQLYFSDGSFYDSRGTIGVFVNNYQENAGDVRIISLNDQREISLGSFLEIANTQEQSAQTPPDLALPEISGGGLNDSDQSVDMETHQNLDDSWESYPDLSMIFQAEDLDVNENMDFLQHSSSFHSIDNLFGDTMLTDDIDILISTVSEDVDASLNQIKSAEFVINKSIDFNVSEFVQMDKYTDLNIENAIDYVEDI
jgi:hypothetical protein